MDKVLIVGNGFDIYHGKNTRYSDFLKFIDQLKKKEIENADIYIANINDSFKDVVDSFDQSSLLNYLLSQYTFSKDIGNWIDLEKDLKLYIYNLLSYFNVVNDGDPKKRNQYMSTGFIKEKSNEITKTLLESSTSIFPTHYEKKYDLDEKFKTLWGTVNINAILAQIEKELSSLSKALTYYLKDVEPSLRKVEVGPKPMFNDFDFRKVISFNYTTTIQDIYHFDDANVIYPHGSLIRDNIILGYNDDDEQLIDLAFKKYYRRLVNTTDNIDIEKLNRKFSREGIPVTSYSTFYFFGHSLDVSDIDLLKDLFSVRNKAVVYYTDEIDRANKISNIIKIIGKTKAIERIRKKEISFLPIEM